MKPINLSVWRRDHDIQPRQGCFQKADSKLRWAISVDTQSDEDVVFSNGNTLHCLEIDRDESSIMMNKRGDVQNQVNMDDIHWNARGPKVSRLVIDLGTHRESYIICDQKLSGEPLRFGEMARIVRIAMMRKLSKREKEEYIDVRDNGQDLGNDYTHCNTYRHLWDDEEPFIDLELDKQALIVTFHL